MRRFVLVVALFSIAGCSGASLKSEWKEKRGYADPDIEAAMSQAQDYHKLIISADMSSNAFNTAPRTDVQNRLKSIFCACVKQIGERCRQKPESLSSTQKELWTKANAVDMAFAMGETALDAAPATRFDLAECM